MMEYILGIDLGTSGVKAGLVNLATLKLEYVSVRSYADDAEQDPEILWGKTVEVTREAVYLLGGRGTVRAIGLSGQMHGAVLYDAVGKPIGPLINWKDQKWSPKAIIEKMKLAMGDRGYDELGTDISSGYSGAILFGIKENDPNLFQRIAHFVLPTDFLRGKLLRNNSYATDPTNAFGTGLFNTRVNRWHAELIRKFQLPFNIFPKVHPTSQKAGPISDQVADLVGLERKIPIIYGGGDNQMSMLGSGLAAPDSPILINIGTAAQISKVVSKFEKYPGLDIRSYFQGFYAIVGASLAGGGSYQWLRQKIREEGGTDIDYPEMDSFASGVPAGADGLVFCSGPSRRDLARKRGFYGNTDRVSSIPHRTRAVMEGVLMDLYDGYEILKKGDRSGFMVGSGKGLQKSRLWPQIATDFFGKPVRIIDFENAVYGAALMAALRDGCYETLDEPVRSIEFAAEMVPEEASVKFYRDEFVHYWRAAVCAA